MCSVCSGVGRGDQHRPDLGIGEDPGEVVGGVGGAEGGALRCLGHGVHYRHQMRAIDAAGEVSGVHRADTPSPEDREAE